MRTKISYYWKQTEKPSYFLKEINNFLINDCNPRSAPTQTCQTNCMTPPLVPPSPVSFDRVTSYNFRMRERNRRTSNRFRPLIWYPRIRRIQSSPASPSIPRVSPFSPKFCNLMRFRRLSCFVDLFTWEHVINILFGYNAVFRVLRLKINILFVFFGLLVGCTFTFSFFFCFNPVKFLAIIVCIQCNTLP